MNVASLAIVLIGFAGAWGVWRAFRDRVSQRWPRIALQLAAVVLIYFALFPPMLDEPFAADTLIVLAPGITRQQLDKLAHGAASVALPDADAPTGTERVPDLATALRRHAGTTRLRIVGGGLPLRDRDAARGLAIEFDAAPPPHGIVDIAAPILVRTGSRFEIAGRVEGDAGGTIELRDPAGAMVGHAAIGDDGRFAFALQAKSAGNAEFSLRALDPDGKAIDTMTLAVATQAGDDARVLMLAGAPDPELKYLRRWATDAGVQLTSRMALSDGVAMQDGTTALTAEALAQTDLVIIDERAWKALDERAKAALVDAVHAGLGLFLRITGPVPDVVASEWQRFGFAVRPSDVAQAVSLQQSADPSAPGGTLMRHAVAVDAPDATPLLRGGDGSALAVWRNAGQGRVAIWWLGDSYRVGLGGDAAAFGTLWSTALATIARARGSEMPELPRDARVGQRSVICGLAEHANVEQDDGSVVALLIEGNKGAARCAGYWPRRAGWQTLVSGDRRASFHVRAAGEAIALADARNIDATESLAGIQSTDGATSANRSVAMPRWPFFLAWLIATSMLWWLERSRTQAVDV